jgi:TRAP-type uncharacterized transport system substrate-binding protein
MRKLLPALGVCMLSAFAIAAVAEPKSNSIFVNVLAGEPAWLTQASAIAEKLDHENGLRILPILGAGGVQALLDLTQVPNIDAAIVSSDSLAYAKTQGLIDQKDTSIGYIAKLAPLEVVLIARSDIKNLTALAGKRIATGPAQSAGFATGELLFNALELPFKRVPQQGQVALKALLSGQADAALVLGASLPQNVLGSGKYHILTLPMPPNLADIYQPAMLTAQQFPGLMAPNTTVETVAASLTLAVHNWPRNSPHYDTLRAFEAELYKAQGDGLSANLAAVVPGWTRHSSAQDVLKQTQTGDNTTPIVTPTGGNP